MTGVVLTRLLGNEDHQKVTPCGVANGYIGVHEGHPWYGVHYDELARQGVAAHGGLTYSHMEELVWWVGFDTRHWGDSPNKQNWNFVAAEVMHLKEQALSALTKKPVKYNYAFDMATSVESCEVFCNIPLSEKIRAMRKKLDDIEAENNHEAFGNYYTYEVDES